MPYVQDYLASIGTRKCEANALVVAPVQGRTLCRRAIENYLGEDAPQRFKARWDKISGELTKLRDKSGITSVIESAIDMINNS